MLTIGSRRNSSTTVFDSKRVTVNAWFEPGNNQRQKFSQKLRLHIFVLVRFWPPFVANFGIIMR